MAQLNSLPIRTERVIADIETLARFGLREDGSGIDRPAFSPAYRMAADWLTELMRDVGLSVRMDPVGNLIGRLGPPEGPAVICGSHIDSVPTAGKFDGTLGVLAGLEVARCLVEADAAQNLAFELVAFMDEEGAYLSELGARAMIGDLTFDELQACTGRDETTLLDAMSRFGLDGKRLEEAKRPQSEFGAYIELHIEQGPILENEDIDIGIVEGIVGLHLSALTFSGQANHAGTTPLSYRRDAFRAASEVATEVFNILENEFSPDVRLTYGVAQVHPGAPNVVPGSVRLMQEIRAGQEHVIDVTYAMTQRVAESVAQKRGVTFESRVISRDASARMSERIIGLIGKVCETMSLSNLHMPSGAGHDAQVISRVCDAGMIFVPSTNGVSHNPAEYTSATHIGLGTAALFETVRLLVTET